MYELDLDDLVARGYPGELGRLRIDASTCGSKARYINDKFGGGLADRVPNCFSQITFDDGRKEPLMVWWASRRIPKGKEIIADYGPDYWISSTVDVICAAHE